MCLSPHVIRQNVAVALLMQLVFITTNTHWLLSNYWTEDNLQGQQVSIMVFFSSQQSRLEIMHSNTQIGRHRKAHQGVFSQIISKICSLFMSICWLVSWVSSLQSSIGALNNSRVVWGVVVPAWCSSPHLAPLALLMRSGGWLFQSLASQGRK